MAPRIVVSLIVFIPVFAGMTYFMYRYLLGKKSGRKENSYDFTGLLFLLIPTVAGFTGLFGDCLKNIIANDNTRMLVSLAISVALVTVADIVVRVVVRKKMQNSESE
ncbi:MAG: hypothetical protein II865_11120 [Bacteroidales bacterium]|jgi:hypothetical protein|nr:hypothetical protein [Bacteroidales bacterium]